MSAVLEALLIVRGLVRRRADLELEVLALRHQVLVLQRQRGNRRVSLRPSDRWLWVILSRCWSRWRETVLIVKRETVIAWHRRGFRLF